MGITAMLAAIVIVGAKKGSDIFNKESAKYRAVRDANNVKLDIRKTLARTPHNSGGSNVVYPSVRWAVTPTTPAYYGLELIAEVNGQIDAPVQVLLDVNSTPGSSASAPPASATPDSSGSDLGSAAPSVGLDVLYQKDNANPNLWNYVTKMYQYKKYFYATNNSKRNALKLTGGTSFCGVNCLKAVMDGSNYTPSDYSGYATSIRAAEKIDYYVDRFGNLHKLVDGTADTILASHVTQFGAEFSFTNKLAASQCKLLPDSNWSNNDSLHKDGFWAATNSGASITSQIGTVNSHYQNDCTGSANLPSGSNCKKWECVGWPDVDLVRIKLEIDTKTAVQSADNVGAGFEVKNNDLMYASTFVSAYGQGEVSGELVTGSNVNKACLSRDTGMCNSACSQYYNSTDPSSPWYIKFGDPTSDFCQCGYKDAGTGKFYPADSYWNDATYGIPTYNSTDAALVTRYDHCRRAYNCLGGTGANGPGGNWLLWRGDPACWAAYYCFQPNDPANPYYRSGATPRDTTANPLTVTEMVNWKSDCTSNPAQCVVDGVATTSNNHLFCGYAPTACDNSYNAYVNPGTAITDWTDKCACELSALDEVGHLHMDNQWWQMWDNYIRWDYICKSSPQFKCGTGAGSDWTRNNPRNNHWDGVKYLNLQGEQAGLCEAMAVVTPNAHTFAQGSAVNQEFRVLTDDATTGYYTNAETIGSFQFQLNGPTVLDAIGSPPVTVPAAGDPLNNAAFDQCKATIWYSSSGCCINNAQPNWPADYDPNWAVDWPIVNDPTGKLKTYCTTNYGTGTNNLWWKNCANFTATTAWPNNWPSFSNSTSGAKGDEINWIRHLITGVPWGSALPLWCGGAPGQGSGAPVNTL